MITNPLEKSGMMTETTDSLAERFLGRAIQISLFGAEIGINITPTYDPRMLIFRNLSFEEQFKAVQKIELNCEIFSSIVREKQDLRSSSSVVWKSMNCLGLRPPSDFFDKLTDDDVVQVYSKDNVHRFSNLKFFEVCSYTLEHIYALPWDVLWKRDEEDTKYLLNCVAEVLGSDAKTTHVFHQPPHRTLEASSVFRYEALYALKCIAPLFDRVTGERCGFIVRESAELLNRHTPLEEERMLHEYEARNKAPALTLL
ncbi:hypothetical protein AZI86_12820 [Bdellovibrio bacteriovorus]|uniref:Uncharacterized protein n=1 Tax=Bdellovibrio bacteriovorus TaxID=959 RepID=A0A150WJ17_BDEBC|nr:hypothetical protein [Bdellovibrio bacteriovorus]KYG63706.1 hypothetical protein AZI86_12820 [Bdellovibrio bacteriovorus]